MNEAANPAQQAAIAISMKKKGKKPMKEENIDELKIFGKPIFGKKGESWIYNDPKGRREALGTQDHTIWKPGVNVPGIDKKNTLDITKGEVKGPIKDTVTKGIKTVKKVGKFVSKNPGKAALIGAGVVGAGLLAKKALSRKKKKKNLKEQTTFPQMQQRIRDAKERRREQQKKSEKLYMDTKRKGVKFYDKKGTGRLKDGKKVYD